ncbi:S-layer homology domain-containing protein [Anaeromicropila herbilytica]|uniref:Peptidase M4 n=1 Tax=Anaeromicropila herbilytica TaxID=2785025 RepID=A0A7R7IE34_9FIRM|nr:S-layer homology domain-containing protein [Anaeromicropila herbilytica]BCN32343.1 peptidase M4 [Anaeromicropila herbilytica]
MKKKKRMEINKRKTSKRKASTILALCLSVSMIPINAQAMQVTSLNTKSYLTNSAMTQGKLGSVVTGTSITVSDEEPSSTALEKVVKIVKSKITIPKSLSEFSHSFNESSINSGEWYLTWSDNKNTINDKDMITVTCDTNGNIINYENSSQTQRDRAPKYLKSELKSIADDFIKIIAPSVSGKIEYLSSSLDGAYSGQYTYSYQRVENGIPMPDNTVTVAVNSETKKVAGASINWLYNVSIPSKDVKLTKEQAADRMKDQLKMVLSYYIAYRIDLNGFTKSRVFLAYQPDLSYLSVDAKTGLIYKTNSTWTVDNSENKQTLSDSKKESSKADEGVTLTPNEISSIKELEGLLTKKEAVSKVTSCDSLYIDSNLKKATATLMKYEQNSSKQSHQYIWNINFTDPRTVKDGDKDTYRAYANANVDAKTGKVLSFSASVPNSYDIGEDKWDDIKVKYTKEQAKDIFEKFANTQIPNYFSNSKFYSDNNDYVVAYSKENPVYGGYSYNYKRVNEGITYLYNGIYGAVDGVTGKIYEYSYDWEDNLSFESKKGAMSADEAFEKYISKEGYGLKYEVNTVNDKPEVRLVYRADVMPNLISPFTGKQLDGNGDEYKEATNYSYSDISKSSAKREIELLADMGVGFEGGKFLPEQKITKAEFEKLLSILDTDNLTESSSTSESTAKVKRIDAVKTLITEVGLKKIANYSKIYHTDFKDSNKIPDKYLGYVALAKALGIVEGNKFRPNDYLTREEAAKMIVNLSVAKSNLENND